MGSRWKSLLKSRLHRAPCLHLQAFLLKTVILVPICIIAQLHAHRSLIAWPVLDIAARKGPSQGDAAPIPVFLLCSASVSEVLRARKDWARHCRAAATQQPAPNLRRALNGRFVFHRFHHFEQLKNTQNSHTEQKIPDLSSGHAFPKSPFVRFYQQEQGVEAVGTSGWETKSKACEQIRESISPFDAEEIPLIIKKGLISRSRSVWSHQN